MPLVSIITPSLNQGRFLADNINSVLKQSYPRIEQWIIDGGSTDMTTEVVKNFDEISSLHFITESDNGQADAVNKGINKCKGEIIGWLNSDDALFDNDVISKVVDRMGKSDSPDIVYGDVAYIDENNFLLAVRCTSGRFTYKKLLRNCFIKQPAVYIRREALKNTRLDSSLHFAMDYALWLTLARNHRFRHINQILAFDRNHPGRKMLCRESQMQQETKRVQQSYGYIPDRWSPVNLFIHRLCSGIPLRLRGAWRIFRLRRKKVALTLGYGTLSGLLLRQITYRSLWDLVIRQKDSIQ